MKNQIIILSGPTATGKTNLAIELAAQFNLPIVNFDSLLFYRELSIGTAKPTDEERRLAEHYMIDVTSILSPLNAADYVKICSPLMDQLLQKHPALLLVGGSGFYLRALIQGMYPSPTTPPEIQQKSELLYSKSGIAPFIEILKTNDPLSFEKLHTNDHYRIRRAVEHYWSHGQAFGLAVKNFEHIAQKPRWKTLHLHIDLPKPFHLEVIAKRTKNMLALGLIEEVRELLAKGFSGKERPLQSIGYKEVLEYLAQPSSLDYLQERINISTRQLAKAQRTWFKKIVNEVFHPVEQRQELFDRVKQLL